MGILLRIFLNALYSKDNKSRTKLDYIFYKIIEFSPEKEEYSIRCINTNAVFKQRLCDIVFDIDILHGLHPTQACYIGLESRRHIDKISLLCKSDHVKKNFLISRYGFYEIYYQLRNGDVCFIDKRSKDEYVMHPRDICLSEEILSEFDASHAFYLGLYSALKIDSNNNPHLLPIARGRPDLKVVK